MKINPKHNKIVGNAAYELRKVLVEQTIELLKLIGAEVGDDVMFDKILILHQRKNNGLTETIVADQLSYNDSGKAPYYILSLGDNLASSFFLSIDCLQVVYNEVYKVVRKH